MQNRGNCDSGHSSQIYLYQATALLYSFLCIPTLLFQFVGFRPMTLASRKIK